MMIEVVPIVCCTQLPPASPDYVPVSHDWLTLCLEAGGTGQKGAIFPAEDSSMVGDGTLVTNESVG
jgi:hypothetical protein